MRLFWKFFLFLSLALLFTATLSGWLSQKWLAENQQIEKQLTMLAALGETAAGLYHEGGIHAYRQWHRHTMRGQRIHGTLLDGEGRVLQRRPLAPELHELARQSVSQNMAVQWIEPPRVAVATPVTYQSQKYFWVASKHLPPQSMQQNSRQTLLIRIVLALLSIILISWLLTRIFTRPVRALQRTTEKLGAGALNSRTDSNVASRKDELGELACSIDTMAEQIESLISSHKQLLRDISHELRSPLARLEVALELARTSAGSDTQRELNRIGKESARLNELIGEVLTLARIEQGAVELQLQSLCLNALIEEVVADASFEAKSENRAVNITNIEPCQISVDPLWMSRALDNVIRNGVRHTADNSSVEISLIRQTDQITISIRDHGSGANEAMLEKLFEPFVRGSKARERQTNNSGYGLGLAIAKHIVELHRGTIQASNHPEGGLSVTISLPFDNR